MSAPGIRTKNGVPSTTTRQFEFVSPAGDPLGDDLMTRPVGDRRDDLVDRGWHSRRVAQRLPFEGGAREGRHHRRRGRRHLDRVPPRGARLDRHRPRRPRRADLRIDLPLGRSGRPAPGFGDAHQDDDVRLRPLPAPRRRDGHGPLLARGRVTPSRLDAGAVRGAAPPGGLGQDVRVAARSHHGSGGPGPLPPDVDRGCPGRRLVADRRLARPIRACERARGWSTTEGRADPDADPCRRDRDGPRPSHRRDRRTQGRADRDPRRCRRQRRRDVRPGDRPPCRRQRADHPDGPPVPLHRTDRGRPFGLAAAPRPGQPRLLPRRGRWPVHGRLRARSGAVVARRHPGRLQRQAPGSRHGTLPADHGGRRPTCPGNGRRGRQPRHQRPRGLHPGQRVHPR